jgi:phage tail-like protein
MPLTSVAFGASSGLGVSAVDRDPYPANNFAVDLGAGVVGFAEVSGLGYEIDHPADAGPDSRVAPAPRRSVARVTEVSLKRGITADLTVWEWVRATVDGKDAARTVTITLLDAHHAPACTWVLRGARPTRWAGPTLSATSTAVAIEELVLAADSIEFSTVSAD